MFLTDVMQPRSIWNTNSIALSTISVRMRSVYLQQDEKQTVKGANASVVVYTMIEIGKHTD